MSKKIRIYKIITTFFLLLYFCFLIYAVFFARRRHHLGIRYLNFVPFKNTVNDFNDLIDIGIFNYLSNILGNVFLLMPLPFILAMVFKINRFALVLLAGFLVSFTIELLQYIFDVGVADVDDLILNTLGTVIGYLCFSICKKWFAGIFNK
jgi:glycopeptide antibiotics resistance protein